MAKLEMNALMAALHGTIGNLVLAKEGDNIYVRRRARKKQTLSEAQTAHTTRFGVASRWARMLLTDPAVKAAYERGCRGHSTPHNVAVGDFMHAPVIESIGLEDYAGKPGDVIRIMATDDFRIVHLGVQIRTVGGEMLEEDDAQWNGMESTWLYTSRAQVPPETTIVIDATARDLPGNRATARAYYYVGGKTDN